MQELFEDQLIKERVEKVWAVVFQHSNEVLRQAAQYGFTGIELIPSPNIHQIIVQLQVFDALIDILLANSKLADLEYEQQRQLLNAKAQLVNMGRVATALKAGNLADFEESIAALSIQAVF